MKKTLEIIVAVLIFLAAAPPAQAVVLNRIVLQINDRIATLKDYELRRAQMLADLAQAPMSPEEKARARDQVGERVFRDLYEEMLLLSRADQLQIAVPEARLDEVVRQMRENMGLGDEQEFELALAQTGLSREDFRDRWRRNMRMREVIGREVNAEILQALTDESLRRIYRENPDRFRTPRQVRVREVVVLDGSPLGADERRELAAELTAALAAGEDVEARVSELAAEETTSTFIDLGWVGPGELSPALDEVVFELPEGGVSEPVTARGGLHVLQVLERREPMLQPFDEVVQNIRAAEEARLFAARYEQYLDDLEEGSFIRLEPPPEAAEFRGVAGSIAEEVVVASPEEALEEEMAEVAEESAEKEAEPSEILPVGVATGSETDPATDPGGSELPPVEPDLPRLEPVPPPDAPEPPDPPPTR